MICALIICALTALAVFLSVLIKPEFRIGHFTVGSYWLVSLLGALVLIVTGTIPLDTLWAGLTAPSAVNPLKILVLFLSMTALSVFLDELGFFRYLASVALARAGGSQKRLFLILYLTVSVLTVFTSNDIVVLTFTPFICCFARRARIDPLPYLFAEFVASNTWSMILIIGNPTNIYIASAAGIDFASYVAVMALPTVCAGIVAFGMLFLLFRKRLRVPISVCEEKEHIKEPGALALGLFHLLACTVLLAIGSYIGFDMWLVALGFALSLFLSYTLLSLVHDDPPSHLFVTLKRLPYQLIPFVLSMFTVVLSLDYYGLTDRLAELLSNGMPVLSYGVSSFFAANLINNIPMSVLFSAVGEGAAAIGSLGGVYATVVGSNLGAFLTPVGALAGIMWAGILKKEDVPFSFRTFIKYGVMISLPTLAAALGVLLVVFL